MENNPIFKHIHHICIVVHDMDKTIKFYESIGIGPWHDHPISDAFRQDISVKFVDDFMLNKYAYANLENIQIQLCQPSSENTEQGRFLKEKGEGVFHLGFTVDDIKATEEKAHGLGLMNLIRGRSSANAGFTYFDTQNHAGVVLQIRAVSPSGDLPQR